ncbi:DUF1828 domain-containing protein [Bradyrhizobium diversitatis]|uniref:DUF1828 domain-containing protein n=1 Tax=Bradyrhizobium diversitatis TaxID=2755406 RepID=A0ABS0P2Q1_9BRAD|nr:DUF1828 domain-containing protein [Bradyrhizobium diversitatis]MBH5387362.1 DUF1828 domain-containing protein [Bradyrhizobium diversitatis]
MNKEEICRAFCNEISVKEVPAGLAVSTAFRRSDGDAVSFYIVKDSTLPGLVRIEDDGETIPYLEACGVDFTTQTRMKAFHALLKEHGADFDESESIVHTPAMRQEDVPGAALRFVALMLRLADFLLLREEHVESTFKEDAASRIKAALGDRARISENVLVSPQLTEIAPDLIIRTDKRDPVAVFFAQSAPRVYEAIILQMAAIYEARQALSVIALLETENSISRDMQKRASNRLSAITFWRGDEVASIQRIEREAVGAQGLLH